MNKKALVIGATGATGKSLVTQLCKGSDFSEVHVFVRKNGFEHLPKLHVHEVNFDHLENWGNLLQGDVLFSALGTTIKQAKTKENQYKIDVTYQFQTAKFAQQNGVDTYVLVSAYGANPKSRIFYSRMKGELEEQVKQLPFKSIHLFKPGILDRGQHDDRAGEQFGLKSIRFLNKLGLLLKYKPLPVALLAEKMCNVSLSTNKKGIHVYELNQIHTL